MNRREAVELLAVTPLLGALRIPPAAAQRAARLVRETLSSPPGADRFAPTFFTPHEWETVRVLVDLVIPKDGRSGSATDAGVPEFMDFILVAYPENQLWMRGGLAWLDAECVRRFGSTFVEGRDTDRVRMLDDIAWPDHAPAMLHQGVVFFSKFRDLTASGFWSSEIGVADLQYLGNTFVSDWRGCPPAQLARLGVRYRE